jgi:hypothetical protein
MHTLKPCLLLLALASVAASGQAQEGLLQYQLKPKLFTPRNGRWSLGWVAHGNYLRPGDRNRASTFTSFYTQVVHNLPENSTLDYTNTMVPSFSGGILLEWSSPNSHLAIDGSIEYNRQAFSITYTQRPGLYQTYNFRDHRLILPAALRFRFGAVHRPSKFFLRTGAFYAFPLSFRRLDRRDRQRVAGVQRTALGWTASAGFEWWVAKGPDARYLFDVIDGLLFNPVIDLNYPRIWFFFRADYLPDNVLKPSTGEKILPGSGYPDLSLRTTNISIGAALLLVKKNIS